MQRLNETTKDDKGAALIGVLFLVFLTTWAAAGIGRVVSEDSTMHRQIFARTSSNTIAQGALAQALGHLSENTDNIENTTLPPQIQSGSMGKGTYTTQLINLDPKTPKDYVLEATGKYFDHTAWRRVYFEFPYKEAFQYGIFTDGDINITGQTKYVARGTHSNGDTTFKGSCASTVDGNVSSHGSVDNKKDPTIGDGEIQKNTSYVDPPKVDLNTYYQTANSNGAVYEQGGSNQAVQLTNTGSGDLLIEEPDGDEYTGAPSGGVVWINGDAEIGNNTPDIDATVIATGNIIQKSNATIDPPTPANGTAPLALASKNGYIDFRGQSEIHGLVYTASSGSASPGNTKSPGGIYLHGGTDVYGSISGHGTVDSQGNWELSAYKKSQPPLEDNYKMDILAWE